MIHVNLIEDVLDHGVLKAVSNDNTILFVDPLDNVLSRLFDCELLILVRVTFLEPSRDLIR